MKITVIGAGAIGGVIGAYLSQAGFDVTLVDTVAEHVHEMNENGLTICGVRGENTFKVKAVLPEQLSGRQQMVLLSVKAMATRQALEPVLPLLDEHSFVVSMQNGLCEEVISEMVGAQRTVGCFLQFGADYLEPGRVMLAYDFPMYIGELDGSVGERLRRCQSILSHVMPIKITNNIWGYLWAKMCLGSVYFAAALTELPFSQVLALTHVRPLLASIVKETCGVARGLGVRVEKFKGFDPNLFMEEDLTDAYAQWDQKPDPDSFEGSTLKRFTGIQRDIMVRKRPTEVDWQPGIVVKKASQLGVYAPLNDAIVRMIHEVERAQRVLGVHNLEELLDLVD